jgi:2-polyprenyl-3-methyl-5-hydroxy-6-metoxy-1,4-benzoquinol methylase
MAKSHGNKQKHENGNPLQRALIGNFHRQLCELVRQRNPSEILEIGCGEGYVLSALRQAGVSCPLHGIDFSEAAIADAQRRVPDATFTVEDARTIAASGRKYDLVLMIEVLEHLPEPQRMLTVLDQLAKRHVVLSVPWEPFFRGLNLLRGKHVLALGNDPEHIQHWSRSGFNRFASERFDVRAAPLVFPWTLLAADRRTHNGSSASA